MKWTDKEIQMLIDGFAYCELETLSKEIGCTVKALKRKAERLRLSRATNNQIVDDYKYCSFCKKEEHISNFYKNKSSSYRHEYYCKKYYELKRLNLLKQNATPPLLQPNKKRGNPTETHNFITNRPRNPVVIRRGIKGKICNQCKQWKPLDDYGNDKKGIAQKRARCKCCYKENQSRVSL